MITDEERCEVARRLRYMRLKPWDDTACEIASCAGIVCCNSECHGSDETPECARALCDRLADLIEPGEPKGVCGECGHFNRSDRFLPCDAFHGITAADVGACEDFEPRKVDRDALLALADEIEFDGAGALDDGDWCKPLLIEYAHRIREALGVER